MVDLIDFANGRLGAGSIDHIEGWIAPQAQLLSELLLQQQVKWGYATTALELGVFKGKFLSVLAKHYGDADCAVVGVDAFLDGDGQKLEQTWIDHARAKIIEDISAVSHADVKLVDSYSANLKPKNLLSFAPRKYSFVSIDAGRSKTEVESDLALVNKVMSQQGVVAIDSVFSAEFPGVSEGFFSYFLKKKPDLAPFAACGNKLFCSRRGMHQKYLDATFEFLGTTDVGFDEFDLTRGRLDGVTSASSLPVLTGWPIITFF